MASEYLVLQIEEAVHGGGGAQSCCRNCHTATFSSSDWRRAGRPLGSVSGLRLARGPGKVTRWTNAGCRSASGPSASCANWTATTWTRRPSSNDCWTGASTTFCPVRGGSGKSLFLDTLKELFKGSERTVRRLVRPLALDLVESPPRGAAQLRRPSLREPPDNPDANLAAQFDDIELQAGVSPRYDTAPERFGYLIRTLHRQTGQRVVVLVDEYDKPILDAIEDRDGARANRDYLRGLYGVIKDSDAHVRFAFLTGISKFSKVNLFSQLNNLTDITLDPRYSSICGCTERDLDTVFGSELAGLDRDQVREWYNGYRWRGDEKVYNPYDVLLLLDSGEFAAHWFETGTPSFLVDKLFERRVSSVALDRIVSTEGLLSAFDVDLISTEALLFQTGYLTITGEERLGGKALYRLGYPNREVRESLNEHLLIHLVQDTAQQMANSMRLARLLAAHDCAGLQELVQAFYASIPYQWYTNNEIAEYEKFYASVFYSYFAALGYEIAVEEDTPSSPSQKSPELRLCPSHSPRTAEMGSRSERAGRENGESSAGVMGAAWSKAGDSKQALRSSGR